LQAPSRSRWLEEIAKRELILAREAQQKGDESQIEEIRHKCQSLIGFTEHTYSRYVTSAHHRLVADQLERIERSDIDRLMLLMPPRHGKSELASRRFPAHCIGKNPHWQFISASATADMAKDFGREVRNIVKSEQYQAVFRTRLSEDSQAAGKWYTSEGGVYYAVGVGGTIMGRGGDCILIDDPFASMEAANSEKERKRVWDWYQGTLYNRLQPGGRIVVINHRMHVDDLSGRLIEQMKAGGDKWEIVELPAIALDHDEDGRPLVDRLGRRPGDALWPAAYPVPALERIRTNTLARHWQALYQQRPFNAEGELFTPDKLELRDTRAGIIRWVRAWDFAGTEDGDWTVGALLGRTRDRRTLIADIVRFRGKPEEVERTLLDTARHDTKRVFISLPQDPGQAGVYQKAAFSRLLAGFRFEFTPETGDKVTRAEPFAAQLNNGNVTVLDGDWVAALKSEARSFPFGKNDDQIDACSRAFNVLMESRGPMRISDELLDAL
jgi:predicted phage terminase large subunit-like protein